MDMVIAVHESLITQSSSAALKGKSKRHRRLQREAALIDLVMIEQQGWTIRKHKSGPLLVGLRGVPREHATTSRIGHPG